MRRIASVALVLGWVALWARGGAGVSQKPTFSSGVEAVTVDALVTENGRPVRGLRAEDFELLDDGAPQRVTLVGVEQVTLNVVLALDVSESVKGERLRQLQTASQSLLDDLKDQDHCGLLTFGKAIQLQAPLGPGVARVREALQRIAAGGNTPLYDATYAALMIAESSVGRALQIVFSDGADTSSFLTREAVVEVSRRTDVVAYAVTAGLRRQDRFLRDLANETAGSVIEVKSIEGLGGVFARILNEFRQRYLLSFEPRDTAKAGWHRLEVRVKGRRVQVKARAGYFMTPTRRSS